MTDIAAALIALSVRQKQILRLLGQNMQTKEIARELGISDHTVKTHLETIRKRLGVTTSREAARLFVQFEANTPIPLEGGGPARPIEMPPASVSREDQSLGGPGAGEATGRHFGGSVPKTALNTLFVPSDSSPTARWVRLAIGLRSASAWQWLFLIVATSILSALLIGGLVMGALSVLQAFQLLGQNIR